MKIETIVYRFEEAYTDSFGDIRKITLKVIEEETSGGYSYKVGDPYKDMAMYEDTVGFTLAYTNCMCKALTFIHRKMCIIQRNNLRKSSEAK